jgi:hypothetical protein
MLPVWRRQAALMAEPLTLVLLAAAPASTRLATLVVLCQVLVSWAFLLGVAVVWMGCRQVRQVPIQAARRVWSSRRTA